MAAKRQYSDLDKASALAARRLALLSQPGTFARNVFKEEGLLKEISRELNYRPPEPRHFPTRLEEAESRARTEASKDYPDGEGIRARHEQLIALDKQLTAFLDAVNHRTGINEVTKAMHEREAARYILSKLPVEALREPKLFGGRSFTDVRESVITDLREWLDRLREEHRRIRNDVEQLEASGGLGSESYSLSLRRDLEHVVWAMRDAEENLRLVGASLFDFARFTPNVDKHAPAE
jgi:hypothetical protein